MHDKFRYVLQHMYCNIDVSVVHGNDVLAAENTYNNLLFHKKKQKNSNK
jgi:hypothetical protein